MEQTISKEAMGKFLKAVGPAVAEMDDDAKKAFAALQNLHDDAKKEILLLANLGDCEEYILWKGADDVRYLVESGCYQEEFEGMTEEDQGKIIAEVATCVDWSDVSSVGIEAGNALITEKLDEYFAELNR